MTGFHKTRNLLAVLLVVALAVTSVLTSIPEAKTLSRSRISIQPAAASTPPTMQYTKTWGGSGFDSGRGIAVDSSDNIYLVGQTRSLGPGSPSNASLSLLKYDGTGNLVWERIWSGGGRGNDVGTSVAVDSSGNVYVTGYTSSFGAEGLFLLKFDSSGSLRWQRIWAYGGGGYGVAVDASANIYVTGTYASYLLLLKLDSSGSVLWHTFWGPSSSHATGQGVVVDSTSGNIYVTGKITSNDSVMGDVLLLKFSSSGSLLWRKTWGGSNLEAGLSVAMDSSNDIYTTGYSYTFADSRYDVILLKFDSSGSLVWQKIWGDSTGSQEGYGVATATSGIYVAGSHYCLHTYCGQDVLLLKFDYSGSLLWQRTWGGSKVYPYDVGYGVAVDSSGNALVTGYVSEAPPYILNSLNATLSTPAFTTSVPNGELYTTYFDPLNTRGGTVQTPSGSQSYAGNDDEFLIKYGLSPTVTVGFQTSKGAGSISFNGTNYANGQYGSFAYGTVSISANPPSGYRFSSWISTGGVTVASGSTNATTATVTGPGKLKANFQPSTIAHPQTNWQKIWDGNHNDAGYGTAVDSSGNIYVVGFTSSFGPSSSPEQNSISLVKYAATGSLLWQKVWSGRSPITGVIFGPSVAVDTAGNVYVASYTDVFGSWDVLLLKFGSSGTLLWQRTWGGVDFDYAKGVAVDSSGNIYVTGYTAGFGAGYGDVLLLKFNSSGTLLWQRTWGLSGDEYGFGVAVDSSGGIYVTGDIGSIFAGADLSDVLLLKFDSSGSLVWQRTWGGSRDEGGRGIAVDPDSGNIYVAGSTNSFGAGSFDVLLLEFNSTGGLLWQKTWGGSSRDDGTGVVLDSSSGSIYVVGDTSSFGAGATDALLLKFELSGNLLWQTTFGGSGGVSFDGGNAVALDSYGNPLVTGYVYEPPPYTVGSSGSGTLSTPAYHASVPTGTVGIPNFTLDDPGYVAKTVSASESYSPNALSDAQFLIEYGGGTSQPQVVVSLPSSFPSGLAMTANATVTNLIYYSSPRGISFTVSGSSGGVAIVKITIPKPQIANINNVMVSIDGLDTPYDYASDSTNYYLTITAHLSTRTVNISLDASSSAGLPFTQLRDPLFLGGTVTIVSIVVASVFFLKRRGSSRDSDSREFKPASTNLPA